MMETLTVRETAKRFKVDDETIRIGLRNGSLKEYGFAINTGTRFVYVISKIAVEDFLKKEKEEMDESRFALSYMEGYLKGAVQSVKGGFCNAEWALKDAYEEIQKQRLLIKGGRYNRAEEKAEVNYKKELDEDLAAQGEILR